MPFRFSGVGLSFNPSRLLRLRCCGFPDQAPTVSETRNPGAPGAQKPSSKALGSWIGLVRASTAQTQVKELSGTDDR